MRVLVSGVGGDLGQSICTLVRDSYPDSEIVGTDMHQRHAGVLLVDEFHCLCSSMDKEYFTELSDLVETLNIDIFIPSSEPELLRLVDCDLSELRCRVIMQDKEVIKLFSDKATTIAWLASIGLPVPWTRDAAQTGAQIEYPCVYKPLNSAGSKGVGLCRNSGDVESLLRLYGEGVVQELLVPRTSEVTCAIYGSGCGDFFTLQMLRNLQGDSTSWFKIINEADVCDQLLTIARSLNLRGSINVQLVLTKNGPRIFEINPRFSSTLLMRHTIGFCDLVWSIDELMYGKKVSTQVNVAEGIEVGRLFTARIL